MITLPKEVIEAWENRNGPVVFTTVSRNGTPNSIYASAVGLCENAKPVVADNYFCKTKENILEGSDACVLFITKENKSYQIKGKIEYCSEGKYFDFMKGWNPTKHPGHAAAVLIPREIYSGAHKLA